MSSHSASPGDVCEADAARAFTRLVEGEDTLAGDFIESYGYCEALAIIAECSKGASAPPGYEKAMSRWVCRYDPDEFEQDKSHEKALGLGFIYPGMDTWPTALNYLGSAAPPGLWYLGDSGLLNSTNVSIVGSRDCTSYGYQIARDFAYELATEGYGIVSGGAIGIDSAAHTGALAAFDSVYEENSERTAKKSVSSSALSALGGTIVVFANGLGRVYPRENTSLFAKIQHCGGCFISEAPPLAHPHRYRFLARNRLIAALSHVSVIVEAPYRSGALSTAHHALAIGRTVAAVPGAITSPYSAGCHRILREGAVCVTSVDHVKELLPQATRLAEGEQEHTAYDDSLFDSQALQHIAELSPLVARVRDGLAPRTGRSIAEVAKEAGVCVREAIGALAMLETLNLACHRDGQWLLSTKA